MPNTENETQQERQTERFKWSQSRILYSCNGTWKSCACKSVSTPPSPKHTHTHPRTHSNTHIPPGCNRCTYKILCLHPGIQTKSAASVSHSWPCGDRGGAEPTGSHVIYPAPHLRSSTAAQWKHVGFIVKTRQQSKVGNDMPQEK